MASLKTKGDLAELKVAADLIEPGYRIAIPFGEDHDFDLILCRDDKLERVQVKYSQSNGDVIPVRCSSHSLTNGRVRQTKRYTAATIDWLAVYDATTRRCFYIPSAELGACKRPGPSLRRSHCRVVREAIARDGSVPYIQSGGGISQTQRMEPAGLEPATSCLQGRRSPN